MLLVAPLLWLYICWAATGDCLAYFHERSRYIKDIVAAYPHLQTLSGARLWQNAYSLIHSANPVGRKNLELALTSAQRFRDQKDHP